MSRKQYDPRSIANYILLVRRHFQFSTTHIELQKILYFCHGSFLVKNHESLVQGYFEAWPHGPVHPQIYSEFKKFGGNPISERARATDLLTGAISVVPGPREAHVRSHIVETVLQLRDLSAWQLRNKSHAIGGPWHSVTESAKINLAGALRIPDSVIRERFHRHILSIVAEDDWSEKLDEIPPEPH